MEKATRTRLLIEKLTGESCPCIQGLACPVLPMDEPKVLPSPERQIIALATLAAFVAAMGAVVNLF